MSHISNVGSGGIGGSGIQTVTGNSGGAVPGDINDNIFLLGSGSVVIAGNIGTNTLTVTVNGIIPNYTAIDDTDSPYTVLVSDYYISVDSSVGPVTILFPNAATLKQSFIVKDRAGSALANNITLTTVGGVVLLDGGTSFVMNSNYESVNLLGNSVSYEVY